MNYGSPLICASSLDALLDRVEPIHRVINDEVADGSP